MLVVHRLMIALCVLLASAVATAAQRAKGPVKDGRATVYFLRPAGLLPAAFPPSVKVDGKLVGIARSGTYFTVSLPAGSHAVEVQGPGLDVGYSTELSIQAGKSYYVAIGFQESGFPGQDLVKALFYGSAGQKMEGKGFLATYALFTLDEAGGRGELAKLKRADGQ